MLLVDDNEDFLGATRVWIEGQPRLSLVGTAVTGKEALEAAERLAPDLVLMDAVMPIMDGFEAVRLLKSREVAPRVVILTLHDSQAARREAWAAGADEFVSKADLADRLMPTIRALFPEHTYERSTGERQVRQPTKQGPPGDV